MARKLIVLFALAGVLVAQVPTFHLANAQQLSQALEEYDLSYIDRKIAIVARLADKELTCIEAMQTIEVALSVLREHYLKVRGDEEWRAAVLLHELWVKHQLYEVLLPREMRVELWRYDLLPYNALALLGIEMPEALLEQFKNNVNH